MSTSPWIFALGFFAQGLFAARMLVQFSSNREFGSVTVYADMDPLSL